MASALIAVAAFALLFSRIAAAVHVWSDSTAYNHCFLVLPMAAMLVWLRRPVLVSLQPSSAYWALLLLIPLSAVWLLAAFARRNGSGTAYYRGTF